MAPGAPRDAHSPIDASSQLADGTKVDGPVALRQALLRRPDAFVGTMTEKLLTYALGRGLEYYDMPAVRAIVRNAARDDYRFSSHRARHRQQRAVSDDERCRDVAELASARAGAVR